MRLKRFTAPKPGRSVLGSWRGMKLGLAVLAGAGLLALGGCQPAAVGPDAVEAGTAAIYRARLYDRPLPLLSRQLPQLTEEQAYRIQRDSFTTLLQQRFFRGATPDGFRAGYVSAAARAKLGVERPLTGILLPNSGLEALEDGYHVDRSRFRVPLLEAELGFRLQERVTQPLPDVAALKALVIEVVPVLELPDPGQVEGFGAGATAVDLITANFHAAAYVAGAGRAPAQIDPNGVTVTLYREGEELASADASDQWETLLWLVNHTVAQGWVIEPDSLLMTGTLAPPIRLEPGLHVADFGELGRIELWVE